MATCGTCGSKFDNYRARLDHMFEWDHDIPEYECDSCFCFFPSYGAVVNHMNWMNHWRFKCHVQGCYESFPTEEVQQDHEAEIHYYCEPCNRTFISYNNIRMHQNSRIHRGLDVPCPHCKKNFVAATGLSHHIESGSCPGAPSSNRDLVFRRIRSKDTNHIISNKLPGWDGSPRYQATALAWNGKAFECYLCHNTYKHLQYLNQHLSSPIHQQNLYHCPKPGACGLLFTTLAGLMNHLESESCGYTKFENVQRSFEPIVYSNQPPSYQAGWWY
ncbi:uncharacterized protein GGS22DRAFT_197565 [Annulohypoxylon maeteangense]|uniref:uncharacterized protein n=1 Tax=Annulohypoxylon maeteangense TaxID=1927788 RepID=UPI0020078ACD|nr:uncharacterized protein GGS22DRAFT_197565 [Annulohypoxylon maeteangense]KAI0880510.1 hypothetical protein GGS22DRAFT_197565 [Annulohypoxylon maeteangense]